MCFKMLVYCITVLCEALRTCVDLRHTYTTFDSLTETEECNTITALRRSRKVYIQGLI